jgi:hypothetical protein
MRAISNSVEYWKVLKMEELAKQVVKEFDLDNGLDERFEDFLFSAEKTIETAYNLRLEYDNSRLEQR